MSAVHLLHRRRLLPRLAVLAGLALAGLQLLSGAPAMAGSPTAGSTTAPPGPHQRSYVLAPPDRQVRPARVIHASSAVTDAQGVLAPGDGVARFRRSLVVGAGSWPSGTTASASSQLDARHPASAAVDDDLDTSWADGTPPTGPTASTPPSATPPGTPLQPRDLPPAIDGFSSAMVSPPGPPVASPVPPTVTSGSPAVLTITAPVSVSLPGITLESTTDGYPVDFSVDTWSGGGWARQASVTGDHELTSAVRFVHPIQTDQVRVSITKAWADPDFPIRATEHSYLSEVVPGLVSDPYIDLDFGRDVVGSVVIGFTGASRPAPEVRIATSETEANLGPRSDYTRSDYGPSLDGKNPGPGTDQVVPDPSGQTWTDSNDSEGLATCQFGTHVCATGIRGFRYARVYLGDAPGDAAYAARYGWVDIDDVLLDFTATLSAPGTSQGWFLSSDDLLNRAWYSSTYTAELTTSPFEKADSDPRHCTSDFLQGKVVYEDGAKRDRCWYGGGADVQTLDTYLSKPDPAPISNLLADAALHQRSDGEIPGSPINDYGEFPGGDYWVRELFEYTVYSGDLGVARQWWSNLEKLLDLRLPSLIEPDGTVVDNTYWSVVYASELRQAALIADALGHSYAADAPRWRQRADSIQSATNRVLWDSSAGSYANSTSQDCHPLGYNALAVTGGLGVGRRLQTGIASPERASAFFQRLPLYAHEWGYANADPTNPPATCTLFGIDDSELVYGQDPAEAAWALFSGNQSDAALSVLRRTYGWQLSRDPGTLWEGYVDGSPRDFFGLYFTSMAHNHMAGAAPVLTNGLLGVTPAGFGFSRYDVVPHPGDLSWTKGAVPTPHGPISVSWNHDAAERRFHLSVSSPGGTVGRIGVPTFGRRIVVTVGGRLVWNGDEGLAYGAHSDGSYVYLENVPAGSYEVNSSPAQSYQVSAWQAGSPVSPAPVIVVSRHPGPLERLAAQELRPYLYRISGLLPRIRTDVGSGDGPTIAVGRTVTSPLLSGLVASGELPKAPGPEGYVIKTVGLRGRKLIAVLGADDKGVLYGSYRLLEQYGARFYLSRDLLPTYRTPFTVKDLDLREKPTVAHRGLLPWFDFVNGPNPYDLADWQRYIDQMAKLRMNTLMLHVYQGGYPGADRNEPFLSFTCKGVGFDSHLETSGTQAAWGLARTTAAQMAFRSGDYLPFSLHGSDAARDTADQPDERQNTVLKAKAMMREIIHHARSRGIDVVLGTDLDVVPNAIARAGCNPLDPAVLKARTDDILASYPELEYVQIYYSENNAISPIVSTEDAIKAFRFIDAYLHQKRPGARLVTGGWFQEERFPQMDRELPKDIIFSSLLPYDMRVKPQWRLSHGREGWAVPWMELDAGLSEPQLAASRMQQQLPRLHATGSVDGVIGLLWRERAAEPNVAYLDQQAWQPDGRPLDATSFYSDYAAHTLGPAAADAGAQAFLDLEAAGVYASGTTPEFTGWRYCGCDDALASAAAYRDVEQSFQALTPLVTTPQGRDDLDFWTSFLTWLDNYWTASYQVPVAQTGAPQEAADAWEALKHSGVHEAIEAYQRMVRDKPLLGGLVSAAGGRWYFSAPPSECPNCTKRPFTYYEQQVFQHLPVPPPVGLEARGTPTGSVLTWRPYGASGQRITGYDVYRAPAGGGQSIRLNREPVRSTTYADTTSGDYVYAVTAVGADGIESPTGFEEAVQAGAADHTPPRLLLLPQRTDALAGQPFDVAVTAVDGRVAADLTATLHYRQLGAAGWRHVAMHQNIAGEPYTFHGRIPQDDITEEGFEYYVSASDGANAAVAPAGAPEQTSSVTVLPSPGGPLPTVSSPSVSMDAHGALISWSGHGPVEEYRIYRGTTPGFSPGPESYLTYVASGQTEFRDSSAIYGGPYSYRIVASTIDGRVGPPSPPSQGV